MSSDVIEPFEKDVLEHGGYRYAKNEPLSSRMAYRRFYDVIMAEAKLDGKRVLDVGCGDGTYTARMRDETKAAHLVGIDPSKAAIEAARANFLPGRSALDFRVGFARDLLTTGENFDLVIYGGVLHHVADPAREIADGLRLAKSIFILEPNGWSPILKYNERFSRYHREHQERSYRMGQFKHWIHQAGGRVEKAFFFGLVPVFCPDWMAKTCKRIEPIIEAMPVVRMFGCGQVGILARRV